MLRCPLSLPLSKSYGARPTRAAICWRLMRPSSGSRAMRVKASTGPTPGGIDTTHRQAGGEQGAEDAALVAAAWLEPNAVDCTPPADPPRLATHGIRDEGTALERVGLED